METKVLVPTYQLAFNVIRDKEGLYAVQMLLIQDEIVEKSRVSNGTSLGHAIAIAGNLLDLYTLESMENPQQFFHDVGLI